MKEIVTLTGTEAEFLDAIHTKVIRVFLLAIHKSPLQLCLEISIYSNSNLTVSGWFKKSIHVKFENSQDYAQKRNCAFMNSASGWFGGGGDFPQPTAIQSPKKFSARSHPQSSPPKSARSHPQSIRSHSHSAKCYSTIEKSYFRFLSLVILWQFARVCNGFIKFARIFVRIHRFSPLRGGLFQYLYLHY